MTLSEFIAEIHTELVSFSNSNDIDNITIKMHVIDCLRKFGVNICGIEESIINIQNSKGSLPENFKALKLALDISPIGCSNPNAREHLRTKDYIYYERIENPSYFNEITQEYITSCNPKIITEKITIDNTVLDFYYDYRWLKLVKGVNKTLLAADCLNLRVRDNCKNHIMITNNTVNTNFSNGQIYIQYWALPTDESGEIVIPELTTGDILEYIKQYVKVKIAEFIIANNKNPQGLTQLYPTWKTDLPQLKRAALVESKFNGLSKDWHKKYKSASIYHDSVFNLPSLTF